jgi:aryl-alcohol dehydrogenase-like predicted oxidoreductase
MEFRNLGNSGLKISEIGLGGNNFGGLADEPTSISVINHAIEQGINYIDTADTYSNHRSEEVIGKALKSKRSQVIIATKFSSVVGKGPNDRGGSRYHIIQAVEASLRRLNTDYIDVYQMHQPDPSTPIEETLRTLNDIVKNGKVRYIGCSNFAGWQISEAFWTSKMNHLEHFITVQSEYNLLNRSIEAEIVPACNAYRMGVIPWGPLAAGFLTGKYPRGNSAPSGMRLASIPELYNYFWKDFNFEAVDKLKKFAEDHGHTMVELAIAWLLSHAWISVVIAGATKTEQITANIAAAKWKMNHGEIDEVESITNAYQSEGMIRDRQRRAQEAARQKKSSAK